MRGIFQKDAPSPLVFTKIVISFSAIFQEMECECQLEKRSIKSNCLLFMNDLKLNGKSEKEHFHKRNACFPQGIDVKFSMNNYKVLVIPDGLKMLNGEIMKVINTAEY